MNVFDMHCDTLLELYDDKANGREVSLRKNNHHLDLLKMQKGNYLLQCFAVFINLGNVENPLKRALETVDLYYNELEKNSDLIAPVLKFEDIEANKKAGKMSAMLTAEEGEICIGDVAMLRNFYRLGLRMMTLTWNYENSLAYPNYVVYNGDGTCTFNSDASKGLKDKGYEFLEEMERLHIAVDVSHLSDAGFWDVYKHTTKPFIASHSNARAVCSHVRNLTDEMIKAMAERGCITGLNYCGGFLDEKGIAFENHPSRIEDMVRHVKYITNLGGIEMMALGSDFDGIGGNLELNGGADLPKLYDGLLKAGFHESEVDKIFHENALRIFKELIY